MEFMCVVDWKMVITILLGLLAAIIALVKVRNTIKMNATLKWIDDVRHLTSKYITEVSVYTTDINKWENAYVEFSKKMEEPDDDPEFYEKYRKPVDDQARNLDLYHNQLMLFLNPNISNQKKATTLIDNIGDKITTQFNSEVKIPHDEFSEDLISDLDKLMDIMIVIFNEEQKKANKLF